MMREDKNTTSDNIVLSSGEHIQILDQNSMFNQDPGSMCTVILDPSNVTFIPVVSMEEGEVVMYNIVDDNIKVEIAEETQDVYTEVYTQEVPKPTKSYTKASRQGPHICKYCNKSFAQVGGVVIVP